MQEASFESAVALWKNNNDSSSSELIEVQNCEASGEMWLKLEMSEGEDVREHMHRFILNVMKAEINQDLLSIKLLYNLAPSFRTFHCAIESHLINITC